MHKTKTGTETGNNTLCIFKSSDNENRYLYTVRYLIITEFLCTSMPSPSLPEERLYVEQCICY